MKNQPQLKQEPGSFFSEVRANIDLPNPGHCGTKGISGREWCLRTLEAPEIRVTFSMAYTALTLKLSAGSTHIRPLGTSLQHFMDKPGRPCRSINKSRGASPTFRGSTQRSQLESTASCIMQDSFLVCFSWFRSTIPLKNIRTTWDNSPRATAEIQRYSFH